MFCPQYGLNFVNDYIAWPKISLFTIIYTAENDSLNTVIDYIVFMAVLRNAIIL